MLNHFRSILLNTTPLSESAAHTNHIAKDYIHVPLTASLTNIYNILFPTSDLASKLKLLYIYEQCVRGAGLSKAITSLDSRVDYDIATLSTSLFSPAKVSKIYQTGGTTSNIQIVTTGFYAPLDLWNLTDKVLTFTQGDSGNAKVLVISEGGTTLATITLDIPNSVAGETDWLDLPISNIKFKVIQTTDMLIANYSKSWQLTLHPTLDFSVNRILTNLESASSDITSMFNLKSKLDAKPYDRLYQSHFNALYRLAGLLVSFVYRVDYINR